MHSIKHLSAPYNVEQVANQRQKLLKVRLAGPSAATPPVTHERGII